MKSSLWIWLIIICAVLVVFWWSGLFNKTRDLALLFRPTTGDSLTVGLNEIKDAPTVKEKAKKIIDQVSTIPTQIASAIGTTVKNALVESAKEQAGVVIDTAQQKLGLGAGSGVNEQPLAVALTGVRSRPLGFLIDGRDGDSAYAIDWGDGEKSTGSVPASEKKIIEHSYPLAGPYLVLARLTTTKAGTTRLFSFPVIIE